MAARQADQLHILIMAGGSGTRFWPKSRAGRPKQLLNLWDDKTLLEHTVDRFRENVSLRNIWIVTTEALVAPSREALGRDREGVRFLGEPAAKNTAPCILWGIHEIRKADPRAVIAVMPADHFIGDEPALNRALSTAVEHAAATGELVTLGVKPDRPETGYGYIEVEKGAVGGKQAKAVQVKRFVEKPDRRAAARYLEAGNFLWNAGMFIFTAEAGFDAFRKTMPSLAAAFESAGSASEAYGRIRKEDATSVDYGVMEPALSSGIGVAVVPVSCEWNDVGSFAALDEIGAAVRGEVVQLNAGGNVVHSDAGVVALLGVNDLIVVRDRDVVLVASKDRAQDIKALLERVKAKHPDKA